MADETKGLHTRDPGVYNDLVKIVHSILIGAGVDQNEGGSMYIP